MVFSTRSLVLLASLLATATSHMIMKTPAPFNKVPPDNSPLSSSGANFPCKNDGSVGFYETSSRTTMAIGETQTLSFTGSAVHGGGSCQLAVTSDKAPTASTSWQVILSIEGGCPSITGDGPSTYDYKIPDGIAPGDATLAWTWISKLAGQPEYYMNCAPITITGGSKKRSTEALSERSTFPDLFVANLASINGCKAGPGVDVIYPDPGPNIRYPKSAASMVNGTVTGSNCVPKGGNFGGQPAQQSTSSSPANSNPTPTTAPSVPTSAAIVNSSPGTSTTYSDPAPAPPSSIASFSNTSAAAPSTSTSSQPVPPNPPPTSLISLSLPTPNASNTPPPVPAPSTLATAISPVQTQTQASPNPPAPPQPSQPSQSNQASTPGTPSPSASPTSTSSTTTSANATNNLQGQLSGPCTPEGQWNCLPSSGGGQAYQRCASGSWTGMTSLGAGQTCQLGLSMTLWARGVIGDEDHDLGGMGKRDREKERRGDLVGRTWRG